MNDEIGYASFAGGVDDRHAEIGGRRKLRGDGGRGLGHDSIVGRTNVPAAFLSAAYGKLVLACVRELDVADRTGKLANLSSNAGVALAAESDGPLDVLSLCRGPPPTPG